MALNICHIKNFIYYRKQPSQQEIFQLTLNDKMNLTLKTDFFFLTGFVWPFKFLQKVFGELTLHVKLTLCTKNLRENVALYFFGIKCVAKWIASEVWDWCYWLRAIPLLWWYGIFHNPVQSRISFKLAYKLLKCI